MRKILAGWTMAVAVALLVGCASSVSLDESAPVESRAPQSADTPAVGVGSGSAAPNRQPAPNASTSKSTGLSADELGRVIYFDFDSYVIKDEFSGLVDGYAKLLTVERDKHLTIEGHADERGGREYNLALGQKRAEAVLRSLELLGAFDSQLEAISFGKERPAALGNSEAAFAKNRRAELKLR